MDENELPEQPRSVSVEQPPPVPSRANKAVFTIVLAVILAAATGAVVFLKGSATSTPPLEQLAPADAAVFAKFVIKPAGDQKAALDTLLSRVSVTQRASVRDAIDRGLEKNLSRSGLSFSTDIKPWLGAQIAIVGSGSSLSRPSEVTLIATTDESAARTALVKSNRIATGTNKPQFLVADGTAYLSDSMANIDSVRSRARSASLANDPAFKNEHARIGGDGLAFAWINGSALSAANGATGLPSAASALVASSGKFAISLRAEEKGIVLAARTKLPATLEPGSGKPALLESAPASLFGALSLFDLGAPLTQFLGIAGAVPELQGPFAKIDATLGSLGLDLKKDVLPWLHGEISIVFGGISPTGGPDVGALIAPTDHAAAARTMRALRAHAATLAARSKFGVHLLSDGFLLRKNADTSIVARLGADRLVVASNESYAATLMKASAQKLGDDTIYKRVMGSSDKTALQLFLRLDRIRSLIEAALPSSNRLGYETNIKPILELFDTLSLRSTISGGDIDTRVVLSAAP